MARKTSIKHAYGKAGSDAGLSVLFLAAFPLVLWLFQGSTTMIVTAVVQMLLFGVGLRLIARGQAEHRLYDGDPYANRPILPRKILGSLLIGMVVMILAGHHFANLGVPALFGVLAMALSIASFGPDPLHDKIQDNPELVAKRMLKDRLTEVEQDLAQAAHRIAGLGDADLTRRTEALADVVLSNLATLARDDALFRRIDNTTGKLLDILDADIDRLVTEWEGEDYLFARRRYVAKLGALSENFEQRCGKLQRAGGRDAFERKADQLLDRMPVESAA